MRDMVKQPAVRTSRKTVCAELNCGISLRTDKNKQFTFKLKVWNDHDFNVLFYHAFTWF